MNLLSKLVFFAALACLVIVQPALGALLYFDGAVGTAWDQGTTPDWSLVTGGPYTSLWTSGSDAVFEGTANTVNVSGTVNVDAITFAVDGYVLNSVSGGDVIALNAGPGGSNIDTGSNSATITTRVTGVLNKLGTGTLTLGGTQDNSGMNVNVNGGTVILAKTSSGGVHAIGGGVSTVNSGGTLQLGGNGGNQFYNWAVLTVNSGGTFDTNALSDVPNYVNIAGTGVGGVGAIVNSGMGDSTLTSQNGGNVTLTANASIGVTQAGSSLTLSAPVTGAFALTKVGAGTLTIPTASNFTGALNINAGTLALTGSDGFAGPSLINLAPGATLNTQAVAPFGLSLKQNLAFKGAGMATVIGAMTVGNRAIDMQDGTNIGTLAFVNGSWLTVGGSLLKFDLGATANTNDQVSIDGSSSFTPSSVSTIDVAALAGIHSLTTSTVSVPHPYTLITGPTGTVSATNFALDISSLVVGPNTYHLSLSDDGSDLFLDVTGKASSSWTGASSTRWNLPGNWTGPVPGTLGTTTNTDTAIFNGPATNQPAVIDAGLNVQNITFDTANVGATTIGQTGGNALHLTAAGAIVMNPAVTTSQTINAPLIIEGTGAAFTVSNNATAATSVLTLGGGVSANGAAGITVLTFQGANTGTNIVSGNISDGVGTLSIVKSDVGRWVLTGTNSFTGGITLNSGTLGIGSDAALGAMSSPIAFAGTSTLQAAGNVTLDPSRSLTIGSGVTAAFDTNGHSMTIPASINGNSGSLLKAGTGTLTLSGANGFGGATIVNGGTLGLASTSALGTTSGLAVNNGGTLQLGVPDALSTLSAAMALNSGGTIDLNGQTVTAAPTLNTSAGLLTNASSTTATYPGTITGSVNFTFGGSNGDIVLSGSLNNGSGASSITKTGTDTVYFSGSGDNGSLGVVINGGKVVLNKDTSGGAHGLGGNTTTINSGGTLQYGQSGHEIYEWATINVNPGGSLDMAGYSDTSVRLIQLNGAGVGGQGAFLNSGTGNSNINAWGGAGVGYVLMGNTTIGVTQASGTLTMGDSAGNGPISQSGGTFGVTKVGAGNLVLGAPNTYGGGTNITAGTVTATNATAFGTGAVTLSGGSLRIGGDPTNPVIDMSTVVGIKFASGDLGGAPATGASGNAYDVTGTAGVVAQANWNNEHGASGPATSVKNALGTASGVKVAWSAPYTSSAWNATQSNQTNQLYNAYLSNGSHSLGTLPPATAGGPLQTAETVTITGIPYAHYTAYVYFNCAPGYNSGLNQNCLYAGGVTATQGSNSTTYYYSSVNQGQYGGLGSKTNYTGPYVNQSSGFIPYDGASYAEFDNLSGSELDLAQFINDNVQDDSGIAAVQIVATPFANGPLTLANAINVTANSTIDLTGALSGAVGAVSIGNNTLSVTCGTVTPAGNPAYSLTTGAMTLTGNAIISVADNGTGLGTLTVASLVGNSDNLTKTGLGTMIVSSPVTNLGSLTVSSGTFTAPSIQADTLIIGGGSLATVPEPNTLVLVALAGAMLAWFGLRKRS